MQTYTITLNGRQYRELERILRGNFELSRKLAQNKEFDGYEFLVFIFFELQDLLEDGCSIDDFGIPVLKAITAEIYPDDQEYFVRQIGKDFHCDHRFHIKIELQSAPLS